MEVLNANKVGASDGPDRIYVGRPSKWGNPFVIGKDGTRKQVIDKYIDWFYKQENLVNSIGELTGKNLVCWCSPKKCHADFLLNLANENNLMFYCEEIDDGKIE
jgi:hypothetical protein